MPSCVITSSGLESVAIGLGTIEASGIMKGTLPFKQYTTPGTTIPSIANLINVSVLNTLLASSGLWV